MTVCSKNKPRGAAIAQWIHLHLPSCRPRFRSQANHLSFYFIYSQICPIFVIELGKRMKINIKRPGLAHYKRRGIYLDQLSRKA